EIALQRNFFIHNLSPERLNEHIIRTIYIGGGTPSLLDSAEVNSLIEQVKQYFPVAADCEITLEANPDDISPAKAIAWRQAGINRLSIGIQSFYDEDLQWMNRAHNADQALQCITDIKEAGFENFSTDLIFGMPTLSDDHWGNNMKQM